MAPAVVDAIKHKLFVRLASNASPEIVWYSGEPTVVAIDWYEHVYRELRPVAPSGATFAVQTNGIAISDAWIDFLRRTQTRVGMSIDGPQQFHDRRRKTRAGAPTWSLVMQNLHRLQSAGLDPRVITVLHPDCLSAGGDFYQFYRDNGISQVSFSIDESHGANPASSFEKADHKPAMVAFLRTILSMAFSQGYPLHLRAIERMAGVLANGGEADNEQVKPWDVVAVAINGDVTSFSPDFMELKSVAHNNFCFGNILQDEFDDLINSAIFQRTYDEIRAGVDLCRESCRYFALCGGGAPSNKMAENKSLESGETLFCKLSVQAPADALVEFLQMHRQARSAETAIIGSTNQPGEEGSIAPCSYRVWP